jgi:hypothetical protein
MQWRKNTTIERLRYQYGPALARIVVSTSALRAKIRMRRQPVLNVLMDNTILAHAITHETAWITTEKMLFGKEEVELGYAARIPVRSVDDSREYESISYLPGIAHLARSGRLALKTSADLELERFRQPAGRFSGYGYFDHDLFAGIPIQSVDGIGDMVMGPEWMNLPSLAEQQRERLTQSRDPLYLGLLQHLGPKSSQDAWHVRTAETTGMFCFLTMDFKLCKAMTLRSTQEPIRSLRTKVMTPAQFGRYIGLLPVNPMLLSYSDASFPVRTDLHWPDNTRKKQKRSARK